MSAVTVTRPGGIRSTYTNVTPATWAALHDVKPARRPRSKADKRRFPGLSLSTEDYVRQYFALNTRSRPGEINAYGAHLDHLKLFQPLNQAPTTWAPDTVEIEELE